MHESSADGNHDNAWRAVYRTPKLKTWDMENL